jgi:tRNA C32,U32 (ribose-2'-O)-methylase TrmJ
MREEGAAPLVPPPGETPIVVLVRPQLAENIGATARAMANGGLFHLRLVAPRDGWPLPRAWAAASGADRILDAATLHATLDDAIADCQRVLGTCPRPRHVITPVVTARGAAAELREANARGLRCAVGILYRPFKRMADYGLNPACAQPFVKGGRSLPNQKNMTKP